MTDHLSIDVCRQCEDAMAVLQNDNEKLEQEINELKDCLKQQSELTKRSSIVPKIDGQHISSRQVLVPHLSQDFIRSETTEQEVLAHVLGFL